MKPLGIDMAYVREVMLELLHTPSPSGRTDGVMQIIGEELDRLGVGFELTRRGVLNATLEGGQPSPRRAILVHADTIGCMVSALKANGRLEVVPVGTFSARFAEGGRVTIFADEVEATYSGTVLPLKASGHAYDDEVDTQGVGWDHVEVRVDQLVSSAAGLEALGINVGDFVALDSYPHITPSGFVKARHLDDKAGLATALGAIKALRESGVAPAFTTHLVVTIAEEVGLGASHGLHTDVAEMVSIDNGVVAPTQASTETSVTIAMQDSHGPFDYHLTRRLIRACQELGIPFERDVFGAYRSDIASALEAGAEMRAALIGFGVDASHGHERTHLDGLRNTAELVAAFVSSELTFATWDRTPVGRLGDFPSADQPVAAPEVLADPVTRPSGEEAFGGHDGHGTGADGAGPTPDDGSGDLWAPRS